jgi:hypothetical protein
VTTTQAIIADALREAGIKGTGITPGAEDLSDALRKLNMMIAQWNVQGFMVYRRLTTVIASSGAQSYTVGSGGDFNIPRPDKIEAAFLRQPNGSQQVDFGLEVIQSEQDYDLISVKQLGNFPTYCYYRPEYPLGRVYFWPIPQTSIYSLGIVTKFKISQITDVYADIDLPEEYEAALMYNLTLRLASSYRKPANPVTVALAKKSLEIIRGANSQVPRARMPRDLRSMGRYNVYSDRSN